MEELTSVGGAAPTLTRQYTYGLDLLSQRQLINGQWVTSWFLYDGHGSVRGLLDSSGTLTDQYDYDAYGVLINQTGNTPNNYLYAGEQWDSDLQMYFLRARYLNTETGRFFTQDNYEGGKCYPQSLHKYLYADANPINKVDPSGKSRSLVALGGALTILAVLASLSSLVNILTRIKDLARVTNSGEVVQYEALDRTPLQGTGVYGVVSCTYAVCPAELSSSKICPRFHQQFSKLADITDLVKLQTQGSSYPSVNSPLPNNSIYQNICPLGLEVNFRVKEYGFGLTTCTPTGEFFNSTGCGGSANKLVSPPRP